MLSTLKLSESKIFFWFVFCRIRVEFRFVFRFAFNISVFCPNKGKYNPEKTSNSDNFHALISINEEDKNV